MCDQAQIATRCWTFPAISTMDSFALASQIRSQPAEIERLLADPQAQESAAAAAAVFSAVGRLDIVGIGTSHNAALTAAYMLRAAGLDATAWSSYEGAGPHEPSAHEVEIKIGEAARVRCKGYAVEQYLLRKTTHNTCRVRVETDDR